MVLESSQFVAGLGHIPNDWRLKTADEISLKITKGTTPPKEDIVEHREIPFLRVNNLGFHGALDQKSDFIFVSRNAHEGFLARSKAYPGDILMNIVGPPLGKVSLLGNDFAEYNMNQAIVIYRLQDDVICRNYFLAYLLSDIAQQWLQSRSKKTSGQQNLTIELCKGLPVPMPAFVEQKKIAQILSTWDQAIATTERLLDLARQQKKALMQQLLTGKKRFPGFEGKWKTYELSNLFDFKKGKGLSKDALCEGGSKCVLYGELYTKYGEVISSVVSRTQANDGLPSKTGDILIPSSTTTSGIDLANATAILEDDVLLGGDINVLRPKKKMSAVFMAHLLTHIKKYDIASRAQGITIIHLYGSDLKTISVQLPEEIEEQNLIASVLLNSQNEIGNLISQLDGLKQEKKALMQALLTGKRRVSVDE